MKDSSVVSFVTTVMGYSEYVLPVIAVMIIFCLVGYTWRRTSSNNFVHEWIWVFLGGNKDFTNTSLNARWQEVRDLESLRFRTGLAFPDLRKAEETLKWIDKHGVSIQELKRSAVYFDRFKICMVNPNVKGRKWGARIAMSVLCVWLLFFCMFALSPMALLTVKGTNTTFWTSGDSAYSWGFISWSADAEKCGEPGEGLLNSSSLTKDDRKDKEVVCDIFFKPDRIEVIEKVVLEQRVFGVLFMLLGVVLSIPFIRPYIRAKVAYELFMRTNSYLSR